MKCLFAKCEKEIDYLGWCSDECKIKWYHEEKCKLCGFRQPKGYHDVEDFYKDEAEDSNANAD